MGLHLSRRDLLKAGGGAAAAAAVGPHLGLHGALAQSPKRGGTLTLRLWDPPHFDPHLTISYKTNIRYTFTHSRLLKHKAGPSVAARDIPASRATSPNRGRSRTRRRTSSSCAGACGGIRSRR